MPGMDGWEASLRIRSHSAHARMPLVVMVTAQGRESLGHLPASEQALIDAFLVKPVTATMLREAVQGVLHAPAGARPEPAAPRPLAGVRLLVAEDNLVNQQIARELLQAQGADVEIAPDGRDAVDRVEAGERYDCVLMDMMMPVMDGLAATRRIRALTAGATLPIVAMTANAMESDRADCLAAGMNDHVGKPVVLAEVVAAVLRAIGTRAPVAAAGPLPGEAAAPEPVPVLDRAAAVARMAGNVALFEQMLPLFAANLRQAAADLQAASESAAHDEMVRLVHTLKGTAGTMGAERLAGIARRAERAMREGVAGRLVAGEVSGAIDETLQALAGTPAP
jgi:CheY-like chemotaxis protein